MINFFKKKVKSKEIDAMVNEELLRQFEFYKASFELTQDAKLVLDGTKIVRFNHKALELFKIENFNDLDFCKLIDATNKSICTALTSAKKPRKCALTMFTAKGTQIPTYTTFTPIYIGGKLLTFVTIRDLTELEQAHAETRMFMSALNEAAHGIAITDASGNFIWANKAFTELTEYSLGELLGQNPRILKSGLMSDSIYKDLWDTVTTGKIWKGELINKKKSGHTYIDYMTIVPVRSNNVISNFIVIKEDTTLKFPEEHIDQEESIERLINVFENSDTGFAILAPNIKNTKIPFDIFYINTVGNSLKKIDDIFTLEYEGSSIYTEVLTTGKPIKFIMNSNISDKKYDIYAFCPVKNRIAVLFKIFD